MEAVTVVVHKHGKVEVNGVLVAEVAAGVVDDRDELARDLTLHRVSGRLLSVVQQAVAMLAGVAEKERPPAAAGFMDGLLDVTVPHPSPNVPPIQPLYDNPRHDRTYSLAYEHGRRLRVMTAHLEGAAAEADGEEEGMSRPCASSLGPMTRIRAGS